MAIAAAGMMATTAMQLAIDAFGPIADNAGGIAEMSRLPKEVRGRTDILDAVGNTTAATGKGFAIASAALTALALFAAYVGLAGISSIDIYKADVLAGLFVGGMIPFIFSSLCIAAVGERQWRWCRKSDGSSEKFRELWSIKPNRNTINASLFRLRHRFREMMLPGAIALITPVIVGFTFGPEVLGGLLAGVTVSGVLMGMFQNNAGGAWDNAKKSFEAGVDDQRRNAIQRQRSPQSERHRRHGRRSVQRYFGTFDEHFDQTDEHRRINYRSAYRNRFKTKHLTTQTQNRKFRWNKQLKFLLKRNCNKEFNQ